MIRILPSSTQTLVVALDQEEIHSRLSAATTNQLRIQNAVKDSAVQFSGHIYEGRFRISLKVSRPNSFLPLVLGTIEPASSGCIVFLKYRLFPSTRMYLLFWITFTLLIGTLFSYQYKSPYLMAGILLLTGAILGISWANFRIQLKLTKQTIQKVLG